MRKQLQLYYLSGCLLLLVLLTSCAGLPPLPWERDDHTNQRLTPAATLPPDLQQAPRTGSQTPELGQLARNVLQNIRQHGWNLHAETKGQVTGGLYINWQMDDPRQTNAIKLNRNAATATKHDPQVDLYYLNALAQYQALHPQDHTFDGELNKILKLVKLEFANYNLPKGWIYFFLLRNGLLLNDEDLLQAAHTAADHYYTNWYNPEVGLIYNKEADPANFNVEHTLNCGAALIDAGRRWNDSAWVQAGEHTIQQTITYAYNQQYHLFYNNMIVRPNGTIEIQNAQAKPSTQGNGIMALITAYRLTHNDEYLNAARNVLDGMFKSSLWDQQHHGLFFALDMEKNELQDDYKETRGQTLSLISLYRYNLLMREMGTSELHLEKQQQLVDILSTRFYQAHYHGFFYRMTPTYEIYTSRPGKGIGVENFFTTEAMGTALDALQQTAFSRLQI